MTGPSLPDDPGLDVEELLRALDTPAHVTAPSDPTRQAVEEMAREVAALLAAFADGTVKAPAAVRRRVEGAALALDMLAGAPTDDLLATFRRAPGDPAPAPASSQVPAGVRARVRADVRAAVARAHRPR